MNSQLWWYTARASGLLSWALLSTSVLWGLALSTKVFGGRPRPNWMLDLHRFVGGASVVFVAVHLASLLLDSYVEFSPVDLLVPFASSWNPGAVAWGIAAFYLLIAIELTSLLRKRIPKRAWRAVHVSSFPLFAIATVHLFTAGTDAASPATRIAATAVSLAVIGLTVHRVHLVRHPRTPSRVPVTRPTPTAWADAPLPTVPPSTSAQLGATPDPTPSLV